MTKVFIATPAFQGKVNIEYSICLGETQMLLLRNGINSMNRIVNSGSLLCAERNSLLMQFLETDCTHILCIDSDLGWNPQAVINMIKKDCEFICGVYPARGTDKFLFRAVYNDDSSLLVDKEKRLIKATHVPAGFLLIKREVLEKIQKDRKDLFYTAKSDKETNSFGFFNTEIRDGEFWGEDYVFCDRVRQSGFEIWIEPNIQFSHDGTIGSLLDIISNNKEGITQ